MNADMMLPTPTPAELEPCYHVAPQGANEGVRGCTHYSRNCKKFAECCRKFVACRLCHDDEPMSLKVAHKLDRHRTKLMLCMLCHTVQPCAQSCTSCKEQMAVYFCAICKFWDNDPTKEIYHCADCGICRRGRGLNIDYIHCHKCGCCTSMSEHTAGSHKCIENTLHANCPICLEDMFSSTTAAHFMRCGHAIHSTCLDEFRRAGHFRCPSCNMSLSGMNKAWRQMQEHLALNPMPPEFASTTATYLCNDCNVKSTGAYHFLGLQCMTDGCGSFNTSQLSVENYPSHAVMRELMQREGQPFHGANLPRAAAAPDGAAPALADSPTESERERDDDADEWVSDRSGAEDEGASSPRIAELDLD